MTKAKKELKPNEKLNKKLQKWLESLEENEGWLSTGLGFSNQSLLSKRISGAVPWKVEEAHKIESLTGGAIKKEEVCPQFFKTYGAI